MKSEENKNNQEFTFWRKIKFLIVITIISIFAFILLGEFYFRVFNPQGYLFPKLSYSEKYRKIAPPNETMEHYVPPSRRYYSTNEFGFRGKNIQISNKYPQKNIVLLGDSYTFGIGCNDGDEFASVLADDLSEDFNIINTGSNGWGLTQQIRVFYEFGQLYYPKFVVILFSNNDPNDNLKDNCTRIEDGRFVFENFNSGDNFSLYRLNKSLSQSVIQKSHLYNALTKIVWSSIKKSQVHKTEKDVQKVNQSNPDKVDIKEKLYIELLTLFANDLYEKETKLIFISVNRLSDNGIYSEVDKFPYIKDSLLELDSLGILDYININKWFEKEDMVKSPVGHYGERWNSVFGNHLAEYIKNTTTLNH